MGEMDITRNINGFVGRGVLGLKGLLNIENGKATMEITHIMGKERTKEAREIHYILDLPKKGEPYGCKVSFEAADKVGAPGEAVEALKELFGKCEGEQAPGDSELFELWDKYNLWETLVIVTRDARPNRGEKSWLTRNSLGEYKQLKPAMVASRLIEAMVSSRPCYDAVRVKDIPRPLDDVDKLMIYAIAVELGNQVEKVRKEQGEEAAAKLQMVAVESEGNKYIQAVQKVDMQFISDRVVDAFKASRWRGEDIEELKKRIWSSIDNLSKLFYLRFRDYEGKIFERETPFRFITPGFSGSGEYLINSLFTYAVSDYYTFVDYAKLCESRKDDFGDVYFNLYNALGANRAQLSRANGKPVTITFAELFPEDTDKPEEKPVSASALRKRKHDRLKKARRAIEKLKQDGEKAELSLDSKSGDVTAKPDPSKVEEAARKQEEAKKPGRKRKKLS